MSPKAVARELEIVFRLVAIGIYIEPAKKKIHWAQTFTRAARSVDSHDTMILRNTRRRTTVASRLIPLGIVVASLFPVIALGQSSKNVIALPFEHCVVGAPLTATRTVDYEPAQNSPDPVTMHRDGTLYRDSEGRTRTELKYTNQPLLVYIQDCLVGFTYRWRVGDTNAVRIKMHVGHPYDAMTAPKLDDGKNAVMMDGVPTHYSHRTLKESQGKIEQYVEYWYAPSLDLYLMEVFCTADIGKTTWRILNLNMGEPDEALFRVPAGMTIQDGAPTPPGKSQ